MKIPIFPGKYHQDGGFPMAMLVSWRVVRVTIGKARDGIEFILEKLPVDFAFQSFNLRCLWEKLMHHHKFTSKKIATQQCPMRLWHHVYKSHSFDQTPNWVCTWTFKSGCQLNPKGWWRLTPSKMAPRLEGAVKKDKQLSFKKAFSFLSSTKSSSELFQLDVPSVKLFGTSVGEVLSFPSSRHPDQSTADKGFSRDPR